ncbi:hypothetical protein K438DRAFT_2015476 [Mycena galopus ATCC 62051]|nr:hypothetical protein K438DRAFT_2015476 [Mycena galopus ATCC 62051]
MYSIQSNVSATRCPTFLLDRRRASESNVWCIAQYGNQVSKRALLPSFRGLLLATIPGRPALNSLSPTNLKVEATFEYYDSARPSYAFNTILPDLVGSTLATHISTRSSSPLRPIILKFASPASSALNVRDVTSLHLAVLLSMQTEGKGLWAADAHR